MLVERKHQPDILEVISDLSSDEKFTPPSVANAILDLLPEEVWDDPTLRWLDPGCKTGVFLREAAKRLLQSDGMKAAFPDEEDRLDHILTKMLHGLAITELTSLMSRRTLYCSKDAKSERSAACLPSSDGNIWFHRTEHSYAGAKCHECGAHKDHMERDNRENYAYSFIHEGGRKAVGKDMDMKFDVIVGNPPYHMATSSETSQARPIYNEFVEQAIELNPSYIAMVIPSRWMTGGMGLDQFRRRMLGDKRLRKLVDYQDARTLFPTINLNGGVCIFLYDRAYEGPCEVTYVGKSRPETVALRELDEFDIVIRSNEALPILEKVISKGGKTFDARVSPINPFGFPTNFVGRATAPKGGRGVELYGLRSRSWVTRGEVKQRPEWIDEFKVLIPKATDGNEIYPLPVLTEPVVAPPGSACTMTYLSVGPWSSAEEADNCAAYMTTRFFRFLLSLRKHTQDNSREKFSFIPDLDMSRRWTDDDLYSLYGITEDEQAFIAEQIRGWGE